MLLLLGLLIALQTAASTFQADPPMSCAACDEWNAPQAPFRVFGNTYFVGTAGLSSVLITSDEGHILLEDFPGSGKTTLAKALGDCIIDDQPDDNIVSIRRIQFTPDLLPSDVTGTTIFDPNTNKFFFRPGPVFSS